MKTFKVEVWEEMGGYITIEAESPREAEYLAKEHIDVHGMNSVDGIEVDVTHRDVTTSVDTEIEKSTA